MVERCVRDAEVAGSNPVASILGRGTVSFEVFRAYGVFFTDDTYDLPQAGRMYFVPYTQRSELMLFTRESDYAIRIVRALKDGSKIKAHDICNREEIPEAFAYKILKKLEKADILKVIRGTNGGCVLLKNPDELYLYDIVIAIEPDFAVTRCIHEDCTRDTDEDPCAVHKEMQRIQKVLSDELKKYSLGEIIRRKDPKL